MDRFVIRDNSKAVSSQSTHKPAASPGSPPPPRPDYTPFSNSPQRPLSTHGPERASSAGTPAQPPPTTSPEPARRNSAQMPAGKPSHPRVAVLLPASPSKKLLKVEHESLDEDADELVTSDLSPQFTEKLSVARTAPSTLYRVRNESEDLPDAYLQSETTSVAVSRAASTGSGKGRPKGWRPGMSYSEMRGHSRRPPGQTKPKAPGTHPKKRGRPFKLSSPTPEQIHQQLNPTFVSFACEWAACKAELHNLVTLRRHIDVVHTKADTKCQWGPCATVVYGQTFTTKAELMAHVEKAHLVPFSWHIGDGPQNRCVAGFEGSGGEQADPDDSIPDYLKDADGNQVTPSIRDQELEDVATWKMNRRKLKELLIRRDENLPSDESNVEEQNEYDMMG